LAKFKTEKGFGLVQMLIGTGIAAAVLLGVAQLTVTMKDVQKVQEQKLSYVEKIREMNDVIDRPVSCRCNFAGLKLGGDETPKLTGIKIFKDDSCQEILKQVLEVSGKYNDITFSMSFADIRKTGQTEALADLVVDGERRVGTRKQDLKFRRTMRFNVASNGPLMTIISCKN
jgi:hypothetical protein